MVKKITKEEEEVFRRIKDEKLTEEEVFRRIREYKHKTKELFDELVQGASSQDKEIFEVYVKDLMKNRF